MSMSSALPSHRYGQFRLGDPDGFVVQELSRVYAQSSMRPKLLIAALVLTLAGADSGATAICAASCVSSELAGSAVAHYHRMESQPGPASASHHFHSQHHQANCAECPPDTGNSLNQKADCSRLVQIQALKEGSISFAAPSGVAPIDAVDMPVRALALASDDERFSPVEAPNKIRSFDSASAPLRI
jgi:hypothetical protein